MAGKMIRMLDTKPYGLFSSVPDPCVAFAFYRHSDIYGYTALHIVGAFSSGHIELLKWNHNILKQLRLDFHDIILYLQGVGVKKLIVSYDGESNVWKKFIQALGFPSPNTVMLSQMEI